jgi:hypothetical protein
LNIATDRAAPRILTARDNQRKTPGGMILDSDASDVQEGVTVGRVRTKANIGMVDMTKNDSYAIANQLNDRIRDTGYTKTAKGTVGFIPNKETMQEGVLIKTNVGKMKPGVDIGQEDDGVVIGKVHHSNKSHTEGIDIKDTSKRPAQKKVVQSKPVVIDKNLSPKLRIALKLYPSFPRDWNFNGKLADRLAKVKEYGETPEFLEALYAAEGDQFRKTLKSEYADQFGG